MENLLSLHEAIAVVLLKQSGRIATFDFITNQIAKRNLYKTKKGMNPAAKQVRSRTRKYKHLFQFLPPGKTKLI